MTAPQRQPGGKRRRRARRPRRAYSVYVIELHREAVPARHARAGVKGCVYVGQTVRTPEERFAQHMRGGRLANTKVYKYGVRLRPDLYGAWNPFSTRREAEEAEQALAMELEKRGYVVYWG